MQVNRDAETVLETPAPQPPTTPPTAPEPSPQPVPSASSVPMAAGHVAVESAFDAPLESAVGFYRKRPVVISALRLDRANVHLAQEFCGGDLYADADGAGVNHLLVIKTLEGDMIADEGDWIIRGVKGEFYPCKPEVFDVTYERALPA